jgi:Domain of unknown function (DUF6398)
MAKRTRLGGGKGKGGGKEAERAKLDAVFAEITRRTDAFCKEHLDAEYADLSRMVAENLRNERKSPLLKGTPEGWAAGIVYTVGWVNFLSDPAQKPHMKSKELFRLMGVSESTGTARSMEIRKLFKLTGFDPRLCRRSLMDDNPLVWLIQLDNGIIDDARRYPRHMQEQLVEMGLIPYVHPDAADEAGEEGDAEEASDDGVAEGNGHAGNGHPA